jgi:hypothetical protein
MTPEDIRSAALLGRLTTEARLPISPEMADRCIEIIAASFRDVIVQATTARAEIEESRELLLNGLDIDRVKEKDLPLYALASKAANGIYWRDQEIANLRVMCVEKDSVIATAAIRGSK